MTKRIYKYILLCTLLIFVFSIIVFLGGSYQFYSQEEIDRMNIQGDLIAKAITSEGEGYLESIDLANYRITYVAHDGTVLFDSQNALVSENHADREEIREALESGYGESTRQSSTILKYSIYVARLLKNGNILRISTTQGTIVSLMISMLSPIAFLLLIILFGAWWFAYHLANKVTEPLNSIDLERPLQSENYEEIQPLLNRIDWQQKSIHQKEESLKQHQKEVDVIIDNMDEGVLMLDSNGTILAINERTKSIFGIDDSYLGRKYDLIIHDEQLSKAISESRDGIKNNLICRLKDNDYSIEFNPIVNSEGGYDVVIIFSDITEITRNTNLRKEFTANVSHELKTPLQSISGYAELLLSDMVADQDKQHFYQKIYGESQRMIQLVQDTINLSKLDEGIDSSEFVPVSLLAIARKVIDNLDYAIKDKNISVFIQENDLKVKGLARLLEEMIFNLIDNAIKYNRQGGKINILIDEDEKYINFTVADNGIGIAQEDQQRIFERFYRCDKSHSKESGGSGLGLSIAKHIAIIHNATIKVTSKLSEGTSMKVSFVKEEVE